jgi:hypothetical protein
MCSLEMRHQSTFNIARIGGVKGGLFQGVKDDLFQKVKDGLFQGVGCYTGVKAIG